MKTTKLLSALLLTLSMGLVVGCADTKKEEKQTQDHVDAANKSIDTMNGIQKDLVPMGLYIRRPELSSCSSLTLSELQKAASMIDNYISHGTDVVNRSNQKGVVANKDDIRTMVENAKQLKQLVTAELQKRSR